MRHIGAEIEAAVVLRLVPALRCVRGCVGRSRAVGGGLLRVGRRRLPVRQLLLVSAAIRLLRARLCRLMCRLGGNIRLELGRIPRRAATLALNCVSVRLRERGAAFGVAVVVGAVSQWNVGRGLGVGHRIAVGALALIWRGRRLLHIALRLPVGRRSLGLRSLRLRSLRWLAPLVLRLRRWASVLLTLRTVHRRHWLTPRNLNHVATSSLVQ